MPDIKKDEGVGGQDSNDHVDDHEELEGSSGRERTYRPRPSAANITHIRRKLQNARQGTYAEIIMQVARDRSPHQSSTEDNDKLDESPAQIKVDEKPTRFLKASPFRLPSPPQPVPDQTKLKKDEGKRVLIIDPSQVERHQRNIIRNKIWSQKFEYLYKQIRLESEEEEKEEAIAAEAARAAKLAGLDPSLGNSCRDFFSPQQKHAFAVLKAEAAQGPWGNEPERERSMSNSTLARTWHSTWRRPPKSTVLQHSMLNSHKSKTQHGPWLQPPKSGAFCRQHTEMSDSFCSTDLGNCPPRRHLTASRQTAMQTSVSLPALSAQEDLCGVHREYYEGDDLTMHEDVLHCTNPRLFPLRPGSGKPFPLPALAAS